MKAATVNVIKKELVHRSSDELMELCLNLAKFKIENKELLTYLLFESHDEEEFIRGIKEEIDVEFKAINRNKYYFVKKSIRKILRTIKKYNRYSKRKDTEVELLIYFLEKMDDFSPSIHKNTTLKNLYERQKVSTEKLISKLHEDLQYDYNQELEELT